MNSGIMDSVGCLLTERLNGVGLCQGKWGTSTVRQFVHFGSEPAPSHAAGNSRSFGMQRVQLGILRGDLGFATFINLAVGSILHGPALMRFLQGEGEAAFAPKATAGTASWSGRGHC